MVPATARTVSRIQTHGAMRGGLSDDVMVANTLGGEVIRRSKEFIGYPGRG